jgi:hypothetical protein
LSDDAQLPEPLIAAVESAIMARDGHMRGGEIYFLAPCHDDHEPSARWNPDKHTWYCDPCDKGGGVFSLARLLNIPIPSANGFSTNGNSRIVREYDYRDEAGTLLFQTVRMEPKSFRQRRPKGAGQWEWSLNGTRRVLYRLPELMAADPSAWVFVVEGEKDVNNLYSRGFVATTNPMGAGKWKAEYTEYLAGRKVCVIPDNDAAGDEHAAEVVKSLQGVAAEVRLIRLPGLPDKGDVSKWFEQGHDEAELLALVEGSEEPQPPQSQPTPPTMPTIYASCQDLAQVTDECWAALQAANNPPRYFRHGGLPSRIETDDQGAPIVREMTAERLRHEMSRVAAWKKRSQNQDGSWSESPARPPVDVMKDLLATPNVPLPVLTRIVEVPVFAADGTLQTTPGYHKAARTYYAPAEGLTVPPVQVRPSEKDREKAVGLIGEVLQDFPFVSEADRANAIALMLLPFVRDMVHGPTPNHLIEAPTPGSGKGLLSETLIHPAVGTNWGCVTQPRGDDELRKQLTAQFREGRSVVLLDNVNDLSSGVLAAALTATTWDDRLLGKTEMLSLSVRCVWATTANNPTMSTEIARRCVRIRLDPKVDRPWQRGAEQFTHPDLRAWVACHRGELVWSALTLAQSWIAAGQPEAKVRPLGSYEQWTAVVGGILAHAGIDGFLANLNEFYEAADLEGQVWRQFVAAWWEKHKDGEVGTNDLFPLAQETELFDLGKGGERSQKISFGKQLMRQRDRVIGDYRVMPGGKIHKAQMWSLQLASQVMI